MCGKYDKPDNTAEIIMDAKSENESYARVAVAAFFLRLDPTVEEIADIKTAVSEAVTNCIVHGYEGVGEKAKVYISCKTYGKIAEVTVRDEGVGIADIPKALEPMYTSKPEQERSGMGFAFMEAFMDELDVESAVGYGTTVVMRKEIGAKSEEYEK